MGSRFSTKQIALALVLDLANGAWSLSGSNPTPHGGCYRRCCPPKGADVSFQLRTTPTGQDANFCQLRTTRTSGDERHRMDYFDTANCVVTEADAAREALVTDSKNGLLHLLIFSRYDAVTLQ